MKGEDAHEVLALLMDSGQLLVAGGEVSLFSVMWPLIISHVPENNLPATQVHNPN